MSLDLLRQHGYSQKRPAFLLDCGWLSYFYRTFLWSWNCRYFPDSPFALRYLLRYSHATDKEIQDCNGSSAQCGEIPAYRVLLFAFHAEYGQFCRGHSPQQPIGKSAVLPVQSPCPQCAAHSHPLDTPREFAWTSVFRTSPLHGKLHEFSCWYLWRTTHWWCSEMA